MDDILIAFVSMIVFLSLIPLYIWKKRSQQQQGEEEDDERQQRERETVVRRQSGTRRMRRRPAAASASASSSASVEDLNLIDDGSDEEDDSYNAAKAASKKKEKKRQEREAQRQADEAARASRVSKQDRYAELRRKKDEEREAHERQLEEEARAHKAREEEAAALEFEKWKGEFSIDAQGTTENELQDQSRDLLFDFIQYIKKHKCVPLEDLAAEFKLRTQDCINRITSLESLGRLSGVMDDRGKYIYISKEEMKAVAEYIKRQGRVSISHLASQSNQFIDLEPKVQHGDEIGNSQEIAVA